MAEADKKRQGAAAGEEILRISDLSLGYGNGAVIEDISISLRKGQVLAIVGESGCGKSTLLKSLLGQEDLRVEAMAGEILYHGEDLLKKTPAERKTLRGSVFFMIDQEPGMSFNQIRSYRVQLREMLKSHGRYEKGRSEQEMSDCLKKLGLEDAERVLESCPYELSGGMNQRAAIAAAMLMRPEILLLDEPTSALDVTTQRVVLGELKRLHSLTGMAMILVTHNLGVARETADRIAVMDKGRIVEEGEAEQVMNAPRHPYTRALLEAVPHLGKTDFRKPDGGEKESLQPEEVSSASPEKEERQPENAESPRIRAAALQVRDLSKTFGRGRNACPAVKGVSFSVKEGEIAGLVGESGSGKSTVLKCICGMEKSTGGQILGFGQDITGWSVSKNCRNMQMIFQNPLLSFDPRMRIGRSLEEPLKQLCHLRPEEMDQRKHELAELVGLDDALLERYPSELSGGQCQRMAIARSLAARPAILLCDEITSALDVFTQAQIVRLLAELKEKMHLTILFITHDLALAGGFCDEIAVLKQGEIIEAGSSEELLQHPAEPYTRELLSNCF